MKTITKKQYLWNIRLTFLFAFLIGLFIGIFIGMAIQQRIFVMGAVEVAEGLSGSEFNIEINFNETKLIEGFREVAKEVLIPALNQSQNENNKTT